MPRSIPCGRRFRNGDECFVHRRHSQHRKPHHYASIHRGGDERGNSVLLVFQRLGQLGRAYGERSCDRRRRRCRAHGCEPQREHNDVRHHLGVDVFGSWVHVVEGLILILAWSYDRFSPAVDESTEAADTFTETAIRRQ